MYNTTETYILMLIIIIFIGFNLENIWFIAYKGYIDKRDMNLSFLLGCGIMVIAFWIAFTSYL